MRRSVPSDARSELQPKYRNRIVKEWWGSNIEQGKCPGEVRIGKGKGGNENKW